MPRERTVFVSCGQLSEDEKTLGRNLAGAIARHGMKSFFAEDIHSTGALNTVIFKAIQTCDAFLGVLQKRGTVKYKDYPDAQRSSVWIQQEIAVFSYRMFLENRALPIRVYSERGIRREGVMEVAIVNAIEFDSPEDLLTDAEIWLGGHEFEQHPVLARREESFQRRLTGMNEDQMLLLELVAAHTVAPDDAASWEEVKNDFYSVFRTTRITDGEIQRRFNDSLAAVRSLGLLRDGPDAKTGGLIGIWLAKQWWDFILDALRGRGHRV